MKPRRLISFFFVCVFAVCGWAQDRESGETGGLSIRLMSWSGELTDLWVADGASYVPVRAGEFVLGRPLALGKRVAVLRLFREVIVEGATMKRLVAEVPLPEGVASVLVVLAPALVGSELPLVGRALDQSLAAHPLETLRMVNFSEKALAMRVGTVTEVIRPGGEWLVPYSDEGQLQLAVHVAVDDGSGGWKLVQSAMKPTPRGRRVIGIMRDGRPDPTIEDAALRTKAVDAVFLIDRAAPPAVAQR
jgi:hypothetical protein